jgi:hypothetical protein
MSAGVVYLLHLDAPGLGHAKRYTGNAESSAILRGSALAPEACYRRSRSSGAGGEELSAATSVAQAPRVPVSEWRVAGFSLGA